LKHGVGASDQNSRHGFWRVCGVRVAWLSHGRGLVGSDLSRGGSRRLRRRVDHHRRGLVVSLEPRKQNQGAGYKEHRQSHENEDTDKDTL
jgi:hypothetical protein